MALGGRARLGRPALRWPVAGRAGVCPVPGTPRSARGTHVVSILDELHHVAGVIRQLPDCGLGDDLREFLLGKETRPVSARALGPREPQGPWGL